ncbi:SDR family oxidoreductase [Phyllobacterium sp. YR531]|uniref:SDR family oxidoreductase n=1 Tax=Phyllobacterium sp. YR531 TaxID=1144343 RepID=UPI00026F7593|nr:SDR family oxidoreductase [Phyllobacterium sp. YR531]EJN02079.1 nucleoside-diphosphate-sugar epimerase [Phyllobacterium sp. YR531]
MHVFVTGATGWVGSAIVEDLILAGYRVTGLARSADKAAGLIAMGSKIIQGTLDDLEILHDAAVAAEAVIHTAFNHDFSKFAENAAQDERAIGVLGRALAGSKRPLIVTSGLSGLPKGATEFDLPNPASPRKSEAAARTLAEKGIRSTTVRLAPSVHGIGDYGFIPIVIHLARATGVSAYPDDGLNCWSGVHRLDAARVYRLVIESGCTESVYHAVTEEAVPFKTIAEVIGHNLGLPVESRPREHFGWFANMAAGNMAASNNRTRSILGWAPTGATLFDDLNQPQYYAN